MAENVKGAAATVNDEPNVSDFFGALAGELEAMTGEVVEHQQTKYNPRRITTCRTFVVGGEAEVGVTAELRSTSGPEGARTGW